ncbi:restriction endonuclease [Terrimonas sp.]|uniref:restriction endonuclease n=1 Tax=Terrimonas sp. TaxID=1914338 RepID=UPI000D5225EE|nr:restriction endonuclease [Terrimonas sp.]PVD52398.1 restriction endonuclease [Terrimonas sp.]
MTQNFDDLHDIDQTEEYTRSYDIRYVAEIRHQGLGTYRILKDKDQWILDNKIEAQFKKWDEQWEKIVFKNKSQANKEANLNLAEERTLEAKEKLDEIENLLVHTLDMDDTIDWNSLKDTKKFKVPNPKNSIEKEFKQIPLPESPSHKAIPLQPNQMHFQPKLTFMDKLLKSKAQKKIDHSENSYKTAMTEWEELVKQTNSYNSELDTKYNLLLQEVERQKEEIRKKYNVLESKWEEEKKEYLRVQEEHNQKIETLKELYFKGDANSIIEYCELVLNNSEYPDSFPKDFDLEYNPDNRLLIIEYVLPAPEDFPKLSEVKYIATKKELKEYFISDTQLSKMYDTSIYNICLRTLHEIFEADKANGIDIVVFNGWVETINKATGKKVNNCIVSVQARKDEFIQIELANVDPKACFKSLKGVGSSKLSGITAVQPLIQVNRSDKRFVSSYDVANTLNEGHNLATLNWEDFEHLIRELFEKEFSSNGGEVKVTQASRDGGVDAVAFDPDPIRGGKIVIQAKRYTNTVGVSAVRDLYGTVMNEGATKGILVSTADYGPDAYEFAKNKPLTLLNGSNLLFLLEKHGQKARIDLAEAKRLQTG